MTEKFLVAFGTLVTGPTACALSVIAARCHLPQGDGMPSQALPRQLPRRGSQAITFVAKVLGETRKLPVVLLALPLGELAKPSGFD